MLIASHKVPTTSCSIGAKAFLFLLLKQAASPSTAGRKAPDAEEDVQHSRPCHEEAPSRKRTKRSLRESGWAVSHCQTIQLAQPIARRSLTFCASLALFLSIFSLQYSTRLVGRRPLRQPWPCQKTPVDEDDLAPGCEDEVWAPRKVTAVEGVPVPHMVEHSPDRHFRARVPLADRGHDSRTDFRCTIVSHLRNCIFSQTLVQQRGCTGTQVSRQTASRVSDTRSS